MKTKKRDRVHRLTSSLEQIGRSVGRKSHKSIAFQSLKDSRIRKTILKILGNNIQKELAAMCTFKNESKCRSY